MRILASTINLEMIRKEVIENNLLLPEVGRLVSEGHTVTLSVKGASMSPFIVHMRDKAVLGPFNPDELKKGDCVLAKVEGGTYVLHRIIRREGDRLILKGDGNIQGCERCKTYDVQAILISIIRKGREVSTSSLIWRTYSKVWVMLDPVRRWLLAVWRRL